MCACSGGAPLTARALAPHDDLVVLALALDDTPPSVPRRQALCAAIDSPLQVNQQ